MSKYIDSEAFFKLINTTLPYGEVDYPDKAIYNAAISDMCGMLTHFPAADVVEVRHGRWEELMEHRGAGGILGGKDICVGYACSECGEQFDIMTYYCPNCGASMGEVEE